MLAWETSPWPRGYEKLKVKSEGSSYNRTLTHLTGNCKNSICVMETRKDNMDAKVNNSAVWVFRGLVLAAAVLMLVSWLYL